MTATGSAAWPASCPWPLRLCALLDLGPLDAWSLARFFLRDSFLFAKILLEILESYIPDQNILWLLRHVIRSFYFQTEGKGLPLGNLTSQLFCNVYMNHFDQFVKHKLKVRHYVRYADDFVFLADNKDLLLSLVPQISAFLDGRLKLLLHPEKVFIKTLASGVDFLGWVNFPCYRALRHVTKRRMFKAIRERPKNETLQ